MSVEKAPADLKQVGGQFEEWRAGKTNPQQRIPLHLWTAAVKLLEHYPVGQICRVLHLSAQDLYRKRDQLSARSMPAIKQRQGRGQFLELTGHPLLASSTNKAIKQDEPGCQPQPNTGVCQLLLEKKDGSRLTISLPLAWPRLETLCLNLLRAQR